MNVGHRGAWVIATINSGGLTMRRSVLRYIVRRYIYIIRIQCVQIHLVTVVLSAWDKGRDGETTWLVVMDVHGCAWCV